MKEFIVKHKTFFVCFAVSFVAWPYGPLAGLVCGFFADFIVCRIQDENEFRKSVAEGKIAVEDEPFRGCANLCALGVYCCGDGEVAAQAAAKIFGKKYDCDWKMFCRAAQNSESVNGDLLTECLASVLLKESAGGHDKVPLKEIFEFLNLVEINWDGSKLSEKPSVYLGSLLNYRVASDEVEKAYEVLGLEKSAGIEEVKRVHRKLAVQYHPDSLAKLPPEQKKSAETKFLQIQKSYEIIIKSLTQ